VVRESGKRTGCKGLVIEVMLQRCDTESITLKGIWEEMVGYSGGEGWGEEERCMPNRQNHMRMKHTRDRAQAKSLFRAVVMGTWSAVPYDTPGQVWDA